MRNNQSSVEVPTELGASFIVKTSDGRGCLENPTLYLLPFNVVKCYQLVTRDELKKMKTSACHKIPLNLYVDAAHP